MRRVTVLCVVLVWAGLPHVCARPVRPCMVAAAHGE